MATKCSVDELADKINVILTEYSDLAGSEMKSAVRKTANKVKQQIKAGAPVRTGDYKKSWATKTTVQSSTGLTITVYSKDRYQIAHLLEKGHANRDGGRTAAIKHIAPAEEMGIEMLETEIRKALS